MQLTGRDEQLLAWLVDVRFAGVESIRWAMAGLAGRGEPVSPQAAQQWVRRMLSAELVGRARPMFHAGAVVWAMPAVGGRDHAGRVLGQTLRHEVAVSYVAARYLAAGWVWSRDRRPSRAGEHEADGQAVRAGQVDLVEVELTAKVPRRYDVIFRDHAGRLDRGEAARVVYVCTRPVAAAVGREADRRVLRANRPRVVVVAGFDPTGRWMDGADTGPVWAPQAVQA